MARRPMLRFPQTELRLTCPRDPPILLGLSDAPTMATDFGFNAARKVSRGVVLTSSVLSAHRNATAIPGKCGQSDSSTFSKRGMSRDPKSMKRA